MKTVLLETGTPPPQKVRSIPVQKTAGRASLVLNDGFRKLLKSLGLAFIVPFR